MALRINDLSRTAALCAASLAGLVAVFVVLQALSLALASDQRIIKNIAKSIEQGQITEADGLMTPYGRVVEFWSDCNGISVNLGNIDDSMVYRLFASPTIVRQRQENISSPCRWLVSDIRAGKIILKPYYRYWHGPQIYLRPLLSLTTISNVRVLNALLLIGAATFLLIQLARQIGYWAIPATIIPLAVGTDILAISASSSHSLVWGWALLSLAIIARLLRTRSPTDSIIITLVFSFGVVANFFDGLYSPALVPTFIGFLVLSNRPLRGSTSVAIRGGVILITFWFAGFCASFASKWLLATAVFGWKYVVTDLAAGMGQYTAVGDEKVGAGFLMATRMALHDLGPSLVIVSWAIALLILACALLSKVINRTDVCQFVVLQIPLLIPIIWIEALRNHSIVHPHYASRSLVLFSIVPLLAVIYVTKLATSRRPSGPRSPLTASSDTGHAVSRGTSALKNVVSSIDLLLLIWSGESTTGVRTGCGGAGRIIYRSSRTPRFVSSRIEDLQMSRQLKRRQNTARWPMIRRSGCGPPDRIAGYSIGYKRRRVVVR